MNFVITLLFNPYVLKVQILLSRHILYVCQLDKCTEVTITFDDIVTSGHWLDLVITRSTYYNIHMLTVSGGLSDHHAVVVDVIFF